ncbi:MAG: DMT family transporter, partial [Victivallales bacterium]|nr:DMT family transporter [Victivallales bacterium]
GICDTSAGKSGFLTALYIIIVPLLGIFFKRKTFWWLWLAVVLALGGSFLLCYEPGQMLPGKGDMMVLACSFLYAIHILVIDRFAARTDCVRLSLLQFLTATIIAGGASLLMDDCWNLQGIIDSAWFWIYCGVGSCAIAFTLQMVAQKYLHPVAASLLMSLESVFAVISGWLFLQERLSAQEFIGCVILFIGIIIAQIPEKTKPTL